MKTSVILRFLIIGMLWLGCCIYLINRMIASGTELTLLSLFPIAASGVIVFVPLYKKYVRNGKHRK